MTKKINKSDSITEMVDLRLNVERIRQEVEDSNVGAGRLFNKAQDNGYALTRIENDVRQLQGVMQALKPTIDAIIAVQGLPKIVRQLVTNHPLYKKAMLVKSAFPSCNNGLPVGCTLSLIEVECIRRGEIISAIKELRARTGLDLKSAKDTVEKWWFQVGGPPRKTYREDGTPYMRTA